MGVALLVFAGIMLLAPAPDQLMPAGGDALALTGSKLVIGMVGNFVLGAVMTAGIGMYAPCMILIYLLGMKPTAAFPIMMGSCAFLMPLASVRFIRAGSYAKHAVIGMLVAGIPAVFIAALIVKSLAARHGEMARRRRRCVHRHQPAPCRAARARRRQRRDRCRGAAGESQARCITRLIASSTRSKSEISWPSCFRPDAVSV